MSKQIELTQGKAATVDDADFAGLWKYTWHLARCGNALYAVRTVRIAGKYTASIRMHNQLLPTPPGMMVDHANGDGLDNRRCNLRACTGAQNQWNRHAPPRGTSRFTGVTRERKGWRARISWRNERLNIGSFAREVDAAIAYDEKCRGQRGEFARPNFSAAVSNARLRQLLCETGGRFFTVCFIKRSDGSERVMHCRTGVTPSRQPSVIEISDYHDLVTVWDVAKREFRCIPMEGILWIRFKKTFIRLRDARPRASREATTQGLLFAQTAS